MAFQRRQKDTQLNNLANLRWDQIKCYVKICAQVWKRIEKWLHSLQACQFCSAATIELPQKVPKLCRKELCLKMSGCVENRFSISVLQTTRTYALHASCTMLPTLNISSQAVTSNYSWQVLTVTVSLKSLDDHHSLIYKRKRGSCQQE